MKHILTHRVIKQFLSYSVFNALAALIPLIALPFLTYHFSVTGYGYVGLSLALISLLSQILQLGLTHHIAKSFYEINPVQRAASHGRIALIICGTGAILAAALTLFKSVLPWGAGIPLSIFLLIILAGTMLALWFIYTTIQQFKGKANQLGIAIVLQNTLLYGSVLGAILVLPNSQWDTFLMCYAFSQTLITVLALIYLYTQQDLSFSTKTMKHLTPVHTMLAFSLPMIPFMLGSTLMITADRMLLGYYTNMAEVGLYTVSSQLAGAMLLVGMSLHHAWRPWCLKYLSEHTTHKKPYLLWAVMSALVILVALGYGTLSPYLFQLILPASYHTGFRLLPLMSISAALYCALYYFSPFYVHRGFTAVLGASLFAAAVFNIALNIILIPVYGAWGAALSTCASTLFSLLLLICWKRAFVKTNNA